MRLMVAGYEVIPIRAGTKYPPFDKWEQTVATPKKIRHWIEQYPAGGVGVLTKLTPLVDIDVRDKTVSTQMVRFVQNRFGQAPERVGLAPKTGILFRADEPFAKVQSKTYVDDFGDEHKVEILGDGQQFVAYAVHPDTKKPYLWGSTSPLTTPADRLPVLTEDAAREIVSEFERIVAEKGWELKKKGGSALTLSGSAPRGKIDKDDVFASDAPRVEDITNDEILAKLALVPGNEDYDTWFQIGMALYHQFEGSDEGLEAWHEWSSGAPNYDSDALDEKWPTFNAEGKGRKPVTARIILKMAKAAEEEIAVEVYNDIKLRLREAMTPDQIKTVCDEIKTIQFGPIQRHEIITALQKKVKELTGTLLPVHMAREMTKYERPEITDAPHWLQGWIHVTHSNSFYNKKTRRAMGIEAFNSAFNRYMLTPQERREGKAYPETRASDFALNIIQVESVQNTIYMPGEDDEFTFNSQPVVNTYSDRNVPDMPERYTRGDRDAITTVENHLTHLFVSERDRNILLDGLAFVAQNPGKRLNFAFLIQGVEGDGKTAFARLMAHVLGGDNVRSIPAGALEEKYTGWAEGSQALFVEEIKLHGHNRFDVLNKIKPLITNEMISVRKMNTDIYEAPNTATYFLFTNFPDALPVDDNDSRYFIMFSRWQSRIQIEEFEAKNPNYYTRLFAAMNDHPGALRRWLLSRDIASDFRPFSRAPKSEGKTAMIGYNRSEEEECVLDIVASSPRMDLTAQILNVSVLTEEMGDRGISAPYGRAMSSLLIKLGFRKLHRIRNTAGKLDWLWTQHAQKFTHSDGKANLGAITRWIDTDL